MDQLPGRNDNGITTRMAGKIKMNLKKVKWMTKAALTPCALYLLAIMPRMVHRPDTSLFQGKYFAHRGLHDNAGDAPENSMAAFCKAVEAGYGMELDVHVSKDGVPVVFHDFKLRRICRADGEVEDYTYEELQKFHLCDSKEKIPKLADVLAMVQGRVPLIIEIKSEKADVSKCAVIDGLLRDYKGAYCIESFNPLVLVWFRLHHNSVVRGQLASNFLIDGGYRNALYFFMTHLMLNFMTKPDFIAYNHKFKEEPGRRICRRLYKNPAAAWTVKSREELDRMREEFDVFIFEGFLP
ncbi:MAG: glycerophosphodiester phosphodiesterase [Eubacterium sp.]|nr:glycerophosphodiester phosphodiesterase [Eubacterium sp.]